MKVLVIILLMPIIAISLSLPESVDKQPGLVGSDRQPGLIGSVFGSSLAGFHIHAVPLIEVFQHSVEFLEKLIGFNEKP